MMNRIDVRLPDGTVAGKFSDTPESEALLPPGLAIKEDEIGRRHIAVSTIEEARALPGFVETT